MTLSSQQFGSPIDIIFGLPTFLYSQHFLNSKTFCELPTFWYYQQICTTNIYAPNIFVLSAFLYSQHICRNNQIITIKLMRYNIAPIPTDFICLETKTVGPTRDSKRGESGSNKWLKSQTNTLTVGSSALNRSKNTESIIGGVPDSIIDFKSILDQIYQVTLHEFYYYAAVLVSTTNTIQFYNETTTVSLWLEKGWHGEYYYLIRCRMHFPVRF